MIKHGATSFLVPGILPVGCTPPVLVKFGAASDHNPRTGCLDLIDELISIHHNSLLLQSLEKIQAKHPGVEVMYADFFSPVMEMVESPAKFGQYLRHVYTSIAAHGPITATEER